MPGLDAWAWAPTGQLGSILAAAADLTCPGWVFFFSFSQLDQFPEGMIWRSSSNPTCPAIRMYPCRQKRDMIIRRGDKFRESSTPLPGAGLGFLLLVGVGRGGPAVRETQGSYHPVEVDRVTLLAQGWAPTPRPGAPPQEGSGDAWLQATALWQGPVSAPYPLCALAAPYSHLSQGDHCRGAAQGGVWGHLFICLFLH